MYTKSMRSQASVALLTLLMAGGCCLIPGPSSGSEPEEELWREVSWLARETREHMSELEALRAGARAQDISVERISTAPAVADPATFSSHTHAPSTAPHATAPSTAPHAATPAQMYRTGLETPVAAPPERVPPGFDRPADFSYSGDARDATRLLARKAGYRFLDKHAQSGTRPPIVRIGGLGRTLFDELKYVGSMTTGRGTLSLDVARRTLAYHGTYGQCR